MKLRGFRIEPGEIEAVLLRQAGVSQAAVIARADGAGHQRLIGYVVAAAGAAPDPAGLRSALSQQLPDYMVPSALVVLERLPLTPNGKLDRRALPAPELSSAASHRAPRTPQEEILCGLFAEVLGLQRVGIDDNFFELGGDSIVSIQLVSRARRAGLSITPRAVFQHQTVAALAAVAGVWRMGGGGWPAPIWRGLRSGGLPATPIMRWLKERGGPLDRFSQAMLLRVPAGLSEEHLRAALAGFARSSRRAAAAVVRGWGGADRGAAGSAEWSLEIAPPGAVAAGACLRRVDVGGLDEADLRGLIAAEAEAAEGRLDPAAGVMVQVVWFDAGAARPGRLLVTIHHLAVDGVSWRILVPDLASAWQAISRGQAVALPPRGTSFRRWAERLWSHARDASVVSELPFWRGVLALPSLLLVEDQLDAERDTAWHGRASDADAAGCGDAGAADAGACGVPWRHRRRAADGACACGCGLVPAACSRAGQVLGGAAAGAGNPGAGAASAVLPDLEGHGREEVRRKAEECSADVDLTRTVGWFTSLYPVRLDPGRLDLEEALSGGAALGRALKTIKEQLRAVPGKGLGYGLLRYLNGETAAELAGVPVPQLGFNYLGRFAAGGEGATGRRQAWIRARARRGWAAAIRRCRLRTSSRSTR